MRYLFCALMLSLSSSAYSSSEQQCLLDKYRQYSEVRSQWQYDSTVFIVERAPQFQLVAELYRDHQLTLIQKSQQAVTLLLNGDSAVLAPEQNVQRWLSLTDEDELALVASSEAYKALFEQAAAQRARASHPDGDSLRLFLRTEVMPKPEFLALMKGFRSEIDRVNGIDCRS